jgi:hypothetical protein
MGAGDLRILREEVLPKLLHIIFPQITVGIVSRIYFHEGINVTCVERLFGSIKGSQEVTDGFVIGFDHSPMANVDPAHVREL